MHYPRGSEWRRWDLHVHAPGTLMEDRYGGDWEAYLSAIERSSVSVIGATDYLTIEGYKKLKSAKETEGRLLNIDLIIPNIEFRISPHTRRGGAINIHLLVSPDDPDHIENIERALTFLEFSAEEKYKCSLGDLMRLGRAHVSPSLPDAAAASEGANLFKVEFESFKRWFDEQPWLKKNSIVCIAAGEDGLAGLRRDSGWKAVHERLSRFSQAIFTSTPSEIKFWSGLTTLRDNALKRLGGRKPCIHGSDAHDLERLFEPENQKYCWIKADPTFEGLRQILIEPCDRVHIGPSSPAIKLSPSHAITSVKVNGASWFGDDVLPLNQGLVAIVGKKGAGKSAIAELIAVAAGQSPGTQDSRSFLRRSKDHMKSASVELTWGDGSTVARDVRDSKTQAEQRVRYLSQSFVEELCGGDSAEKLASEIENIVFQHLDPTETLNASNFAELRSLKVERVKRQRQEISKQIEQTIRTTQAIHERGLSLQEKKEQRKALEKELGALQESITGSGTDAETKFAEELAALQEKLGAAREKASAMKRQVVAIEDIEAQIASYKREADRFVKAITPRLKDLGFSDDDARAFTPVFAGDPVSMLANRKTELTNQLRGIEGEPDNPAAGTIRYLSLDVEQLSRRQSDDQARRDQIQSAQARITEIRAQMHRLDVEITQITTKDAEELETTRNARLEAYLEYLDTLTEEATILKALYQPVHDRLQKGRTNERLLEFEIRRRVNIEAWLDRGESLIDSRKALNFGTIKRFEELAAFAKETLGPALESGDRTRVSEAFAQLLGNIRARDTNDASFLRKNRNLLRFHELAS